MKFEYMPEEDDLQKIHLATSRLIKESIMLRNNFRDVVKTKHRTNIRLKIALAALQEIYTACANDDIQIFKIREMAGNGFEKATSPLTSSIQNHRTTAKENGNPK